MPETFNPHRPKKRPEWHDELADRYDQRIVAAASNISGQGESPLEINKTKERLLSRLAEYHEAYSDGSQELPESEKNFQVLKATFLEMFTHERAIHSFAEVDDFYPNVPAMPETQDQQLKERVLNDPEVRAAIEKALSQGWKNHIQETLIYEAVMGNPLDEAMSVLFYKATVAGIDTTTARQLVYGIDTLGKAIPALVDNPHLKKELVGILADHALLEDALVAIANNRSVYELALKTEGSVTYNDLVRYIKAAYGDVNAQQTYDQQIMVDRGIGLEMLRTFRCRPDQIARNPYQLQPDTKAYIGPLPPGIFTKIGHLDHMYQVFPEEKIYTLESEIGGMSTNELIEAAASVAHINKPAREIFNTQYFFVKDLFTFEEKECRRFVMLDLGDLGLAHKKVNDISIDEVLHAATTLGLELCAPTDMLALIANSSIPIPTLKRMESLGFILGMDPVDAYYYGDPRVKRIRSLKAYWGGENWIINAASGRNIYEFHGFSNSQYAYNWIFRIPNVEEQNKKA